MRRPQPRRHSRAFTLVELVVTIVILGILASIGSISYLKVIDNTKDSAAVFLVQQLHREASALAVQAQRPHLTESDFAAAVADTSIPGVEASSAGSVSGSQVLAASKRIRLAKELVGQTWTTPPPYSPDATTLHLTISASGVATTALRSETGHCVMGRQHISAETGDVWVVEQDLGTNCSSRTAENGPQAQATPGGQIIDTTQARPDAVSAVTVTDTGTGATVSFTPPAYAGTSPITSYKVVATDGTQTIEEVTPTTQATLAQVPNTGTPWTFTVTAHNATGEGPGALAGFGAPTVDGVVSPTFVQTGTDYACPAGGTVSNGQCVTPEVSYPAVGTTTFSCPDGGTLSGTTCTKPAVTAAATSTTSYTCPSGGVLAGTTCNVPSSTYAAAGDTSYSCNAGDTRSGTTCTTPATSYTASSWLSYYCPSGGTLSGSTCYNEGYQYQATGTTTYSCPSGGTASGSTCTKPATSYAAKFTPGGVYCPNGYFLQYTACIPNNSIRYDPTYNAAQGRFICPAGTRMVDYSCYTGSVFWPYPTPDTYSCPNGGTLSGTSCVTAASSYAATGTTSYSCPSGGTLNGSWCAVSGTSYGASSSWNYSCPNGGSRSGTTCTVAATTYTAASATTYSCPNGGSRSGTTCTVPAGSYAATGALSYSCQAGDTLTGSSCTTPASSYTAASSTSYACTDGDTLTGSQCATRPDSYEATGSPVGHNTFAVTDVVAQRARLVTANGTPVTIGQPTQLGRCPGEVTLRATGLGGQADKLLGAYCS